MSGYPVPDDTPRRLRAGANRALGVAAGGLRQSLLQVVRELDYTPTTELYGVIEATRGSRLRGLTLTASRVPVAMRIDLTPDGTGCHVAIQIEDRWGSARPASAAAVYRDVFVEALGALDAALRRADPEAAGRFEPWWHDLPQIDEGSERLAARAARAEQAVGRGTSRLLDPRQRSSAVQSAGLMTVSLVTPGAVATLDADVLDGMLTAGRLVSAAPKSLPPGLLAQVQAMTLRLEAQVSQLTAAGSGGALTVYLDDPDKPVITFLYQQAAIREALPVRLLMVCTTCRLDRVVNPDLTRMRERSRRIKAISGSVGAVFGSHHVSPFILVGRLTQLKNSEPDFVCQRCQGTDADESPITFCPRCGDRRSEPVLRTCRKCSLDLRSLVTQPTVWRAIEAVPEPAPVPQEVTQPVQETETVAGWYADPWGQYALRYWDGAAWTGYGG